MAENAKTTFKKGQYVIHSSHGLMQVVSGVVKEEVAGYKLEMIELQSEKLGLRVKVPIAKENELIRPLGSSANIKLVIEVLQDDKRNKRGMWSRRKQEYEAKIHSGNLESIAEVVRDLYCETPESISYSEKLLLEESVWKIVLEVAAITKKSYTEALNFLSDTSGKDLRIYYPSFPTTSTPMATKPVRPKAEPKSEPKSEPVYSEKVEQPVVNPGHVLLHVALERSRAEVKELTVALQEQADAIVVARNETIRAKESEVDMASDLELTRAELRSTKEQLAKKEGELLVVTKECDDLRQTAEQTAAENTKLRVSISALETEIETLRVPPTAEPLSEDRPPKNTEHNGFALSNKEVERFERTRGGRKENGFYVYGPKGT